MSTWCVYHYNDLPVVIIAKNISTITSFIFTVYYSTHKPENLQSSPPAHVCPARRSTHYWGRLTWSVGRAGSTPGYRLYWPGYPDVELFAAKILEEEVDEYFFVLICLKVSHFHKKLVRKCEEGDIWTVWGAFSGLLGPQYRFTVIAHCIVLNLEITGRHRFD